MPPNDEASTKSVYVCCACAKTYEYLFYSSFVEPDSERNRLTKADIVAICLTNTCSGFNLSLRRVQNVQQNH